MSKSVLTMLKNNDSIKTNDDTVSSVPLIAATPESVIQATKPKVVIGGNAPKCCQCTKTVYKVEEVVALNRIWHKACFTCGVGSGEGCNKTLKIMDGYTEHDNKPFCNNCYRKNFQPKGYGFSNTIHSYDTNTPKTAPPPVITSLPVVAPPTAPVEVETTRRPSLTQQQATPIEGRSRRGSGGVLAMLQAKKDAEEEFVNNNTPLPLISAPIIVNQTPEPVIVPDVVNSEPLRRPSLNESTSHRRGSGGVLAMLQAKKDAEEENNADQSVLSPLVSTPVISINSTPSILVDTPITTKPKVVIGGNAPKCCQCTKTVYKVEEVVALNRIWHKACFTCGVGSGEGCNKTLKIMDGYTEHDNKPFCNNCYRKHFQPKGYGFGSIQNTEVIPQISLAPTPSVIESPIKVSTSVPLYNANTSHTEVSKTSIKDKNIDALIPSFEKIPSQFKDTTSGNLIIPIGSKEGLHAEATYIGGDDEVDESEW